MATQKIITSFLGSGKTETLSSSQLSLTDGDTITPNKCPEVNSKRSRCSSSPDVAENKSDSDVLKDIYKEILAVRQENKKF